MNRPRITVLCGSTRFYTAFQEANYRETMAGRIVLTVGFYPHTAAEAHGQERGCTPEQKIALDELHLRKIDLGDEVLVIDLTLLCCNGCGKPCKRLTTGQGAWELSNCCVSELIEIPYIGDSTRREIAYAESIGKLVRYLSKEEPPCA